MKKVTASIVALCTALSLMLIACAIGNNDVKEIILQIDNPVMKVDNTDVPIDDSGTAPIVINDRTLVPVRAIIEAMGGTVGWDGSERKVTLELGGDTIMLYIDDTTAYFNNISSVLDTAPAIINDRTMLPIRFIAESFGFDVDWNGNTQEITITPAAAPDKQPDLTPTPQTSSSTGNDTDNSENILIAYFCLNDLIPDNADAVTHATPSEWNTESAAAEIQKNVGGDLFAIKTSNEYPVLHSEASKIAGEEKENDVRPPLTTHVENMDQYDVVFIGYPIWWYTAPMAVRTFLEEYDFSGKTIVPFCTSLGAGISESIDDIHRLCPDADVLEGIQLGTGRDMSGSISNWLDSLNIN